MCCWNTALEEKNSIIILLSMPMTHTGFVICENTALVVGNIEGAA